MRKIVTVGKVSRDTKDALTVCAASAPDADGQLKQANSPACTPSAPDCYHTQNVFGTDQC